MINDLNTFVNELNNIFTNNGGYRGFPINVYKTDNAYVVEAEMPGLNKEDVNLTFDSGVLTITATPKVNKEQKYLIHERSGMKMMREVILDDDVDVENIKAKFENGVLYVTLGCKLPEQKPIKNIVIE